MGLADIPINKSFKADRAINEIIGTSGGKKELFSKPTFNVDKIFPKSKKNIKLEKTSKIEDKVFKGRKKTEEYFGNKAKLTRGFFSLSPDVSSPKNVGWKRMRQQKGLNMFGDYDKDGVANIFDCQPRDRNKQATYHKVLNFLGGKGYKEDYEVPLDTPAGELEKYGYKKDVVYTPTGVNNNTGLQPVRDMAVEGSWKDKLARGTQVVGEKLATGGSNVLFAAGVFKTPEERMQIQEKKRQKEMYKQALQLQKAQNRAEIIKEIQKAKIREEMKGNKPRKPLLGTHVGGAVGALQGGLGGVAQGMGQAGMAYAPVQQGYKIKELIGGGMRQPVPVYPQQTQVISQQSPAQSVPAQEGTIYSPYSKRPVTYTRGPYKKRVQYPQ